MTTLSPDTNQEGLVLAPQFWFLCLQRQHNKRVLSGEEKAFIFTVFDNCLLKMMPREASIGREIGIQKLSTSKTMMIPGNRKHHLGQSFI